MSSVKPFDNNSNWLNQIEYNKNIDYFFTQRTTQETIEYIDEKTLERKERKQKVINNFLAINFPLTNNKCDKISIEIWGDNGFNYEGEIHNKKGETPNLLLKLNNDTEIFVKLTYNENDNKTKNYIHFIPILKRYQKELK
jgi:hypothetical protein